MTNEELKIIVDKLKVDNPAEDATFGVYFHGDLKEGYIKANKSGLQLFAVELLEASIEGDAIIRNKENRSIPLADETEWVDMDSDILLQYVEPLGGTRKKPVVVSGKNSGSKNDLFRVGCTFLLIFLFICFCLGLGKMWTMIFG